MNIRRKEPDYKRRFLRYVKFNFFFRGTIHVSLVHSQILTLSTLSLLREKSTTFDLLQGLNEIKKKKRKSKKIESLEKVSHVYCHEKKRKKEKLNPFREIPFRPTFSRPGKSKS